MGDDLTLMIDLLANVVVDNIGEDTDPATTDLPPWLHPLVAATQRLRKATRAMQENQ